MSILEALCTWFVKLVLTYLLDLALAEAKRKADELALDKERGIINEANAKAYEAATDRILKRKAALDLINRAHH